MSIIKSNDVQKIAERIVESANEREKIQNVMVYYVSSGRFDPGQNTLVQLVEALKTKGKLRKLLTVTLDKKSVAKGEDEYNISGVAIEKDGVENSFLVKIKNDKVQKVDVEEIEDELSSEAEDFVAWAGSRKAADEIVEAMGWDLDNINSFDESYDGDAMRLEIGNEDWIGFEKYDDAEQYAIDRVREDLDNNPEIFTQGWLLGHIDQDAAEEFFRQVYTEWDESYAYDIQNEASNEGYDSRLTDELVQWGIVTEDEALEEGFDPTDHIDDFVEKTVDEKIEEGSGGYDHYEFNFGKEDAQRLLVEHNLLDLDEAAQDAVDVDGVAHFLAHYDGNEVEVVNTYWYRQN